MYLHKENRELFRDAILLASQKLEVSEDIVEKDYYVTLILKKLSTIECPVVFKGGTIVGQLSRHFLIFYNEPISLRSNCSFLLIREQMYVIIIMQNICSDSLEQTMFWNFRESDFF